MHPRYVVLLRAITNIGMQPFRQAMEELGFTDVTSYGTSGNLLFNADSSNTASLERRIAARLGVVVFVRVLFLARPVTAARRRGFLRLDFETLRPVERALGVKGTARSARVVARLLSLMSETPPAHPD